MERVGPNTTNALHYCRASGTELCHHPRWTVMRIHIVRFPVWLVQLAAVLLFGAVGGLADQAEQKAESVGLVLSPGGSKLLRQGTETPLDARAGDLLYSGDGLRTAAGPASFLFCPSKTIQTLAPSGEMHVDPKAPKAKAGSKLSEVPTPRPC